MTQAAKAGSLSSEGNDMKPVIYWRFGGRDRMTNYAIEFMLSSLKQCTLGSIGRLSSGTKALMTELSSVWNTTTTLIVVSISDSAGGK